MVTEGDSGSTTVDEVLTRVAKWLERESVATGTPLVVGCSGGADSTTLLVALAECRAGDLVAVHVDHQLREGTAAEAELVAGLAARVGARFERVAVTVARRGNLLANARAVRYAALVEVARRHGAPAVAVGHTATDQAETVAFRALRGDPPSALAAMAARRRLDEGVELWRPLSAVRRDETLAFAAARGLPVVDDPTNHRPDLARTRIRRWLASQPGLEQDLVALGEAARAWADRCDAAALGLGPLDDLTVAEVALAEPEVLLRLCRRAGLYRAGGAHVGALARLCATTAGSRALTLGDGVVAERRYDRLRLGPPGPRDPGDVTLPILGAGRYPWPLAGEGAAVVLVEAAASSDADGALVSLPAGAQLRNLRPGDRLRSSAGRHKLQDMLTDRKVPRGERRRLAILAVGGDVLWLGAQPAVTAVTATDGAGPLLRVQLTTTGNRC